MIEAGSQAAGNKEIGQRVTETQKWESIDSNDATISEASDLDHVNEGAGQLPEAEIVQQEANEATTLMTDDIGLNSTTKDFGDPGFINDVRDNYPKMDAVLSKNQELLKNDPSDLTYQRAIESLERYKGTVFENELKEALKSKFDELDQKQHLVQTDLGNTKPDIVLRGALQDMKIGDLDVKAGQDLSIEAKCGSADYIRNEMGHILKQVEGHEGNSLVVVSKDYLEISPDVRAHFEAQLAEKGSHLYVADVSSSNISLGLLSSVGQ